MLIRPRVNPVREEQVARGQLDDIIPVCSHPTRAPAPAEPTYGRRQRVTFPPGAPVRPINGLSWAEYPPATPGEAPATLQPHTLLEATRAATHQNQPPDSNALWLSLREGLQFSRNASMSFSVTGPHSYRDSGVSHG